MSKKKPRSFQDIHRGRQQEEFVGREEQLAFFRANLGYDVDDPRRCFIINVSGQGGVGKTWLLRHFQKIVETACAITAYADQVEEDVPSLMGRIAEQFEAQGNPLKPFVERYKVYRQRRQEFEADPEAPQGAPALVGRTLTKIGLDALRGLSPLGSVLSGGMDEKAIVDVGGEFVSYVASKIKNKDEVRLVLEPIEVLTPLFLAGLRLAAKEHATALFFDTYERTGAFLDAWLRDLLQGRYGDVPADILLVIAGRDELDRNDWSPYEGMLARFPLEPFTEVEARDYLARKSITSERVIEVILSLSGGLPLLVAILATERPNSPDEVGDPSGEAVARFLSWVDEPEQRQIAMNAALPRRLNRDVLTMLTSEERAALLFEWLKGMPFVEKQSNGWVYHDIVRPQMLRQNQQESPRNWATLHERLAEYYEGLCSEQRLSEEADRRDETWQGYSLDSLYHRLCHAPQTHLATALNGFLVALQSGDAFAQRWSETIEQAGEDSQNQSVREWGTRLVAGMKAREVYHHEAVAAMYTDLVVYPELQKMRQAEAFVRRAGAYALMEKLQQALKDTDRAIELAPDLVGAIVQRGRIYRSMERYEESLADFDRAIELRPNSAWAITHRGVTYELMERYQEALADFSRAIELDPKNVWALAHRGLIYRWKGRYEESLADFDEAIELEPDYAWAIAERGVLYRHTERYDEAMADFHRTRELNPNYAWAAFNRGGIHLLTGNYPMALSDFDRALELQPDNHTVLAVRSFLHQLMGNHLAAEADLSQATHLAQQACQRSPQDWRTTLYLALYHLVAGESEEAEHLCRTALLGPAPLGAIREVTYVLDRLLRLFPDYSHAHAMWEVLARYMEEIEK